MVLPYHKDLKYYSRQLRCQLTDSEQFLWRKIRRKQILGVQFYRQKPVGSFILDFYANYPKIAIELDGSQHFLPDQLEKDINRDFYLESLDIKVLRFTNVEVLKETEAVLQRIADIIIERRG